MGPCHPLAAARPGGARGEALACSDGKVNCSPTAMHLLLRLCTLFLLQFATDPLGRLVVLGVGGHGVVYLARLLGAQVAVKVRCLMNDPYSPNSNSALKPCLIVIPQLRDNRFLN